MPSALPDSSRFPLFHWLDSCGAVSENALHTRKRHLKVGESPKLRRDTFSAGLTLIPLFKVHPSQESGTSKLAHCSNVAFVHSTGWSNVTKIAELFPVFLTSTSRAAANAVLSLLGSAECRMHRCFVGSLAALRPQVSKYLQVAIAYSKISCHFIEQEPVKFVPSSRASPSFRYKADSILPTRPISVMGIRTLQESLGNGEHYSNAS